MRIQKELDELVCSDVISSETRDRISNYYQSKKGNGQQRIPIAFGILGATLLGLGIILILAHNWDSISTTLKTCIAFLPLLSAQSLCAFSLIKKPGNKTWIESCSTLLTCSIASSIALVSQIYNIDGDLSSFLLTWALLSIPIMYVMRSDMSTIVVLIIITWFGHVSNDGIARIIWGGESSLNYWLLLLTVIPRLISSIKKSRKNNGLTIQFWLISISVLSMTVYLVDRNEELLYLILAGLFGIYYTFGKDHFFEEKMILHNPFQIIGLIGSLTLLYLGSFSDWWNELLSDFNPTAGQMIQPEIRAITGTLLLFGLFYVRYYLQIRRDMHKKLDPLTIIFPFLLWMFLMKDCHVVSSVLSNLMIFGLGLFTIIKGAKRDHLGILNLGMVILGILVACRFFDENISFIIRGSMFLTLGIVFFGMNFYLLKKRQKNEE